jgi:hypothetical protein
MPKWHGFMQSRALAPALSVNLLITYVAQIIRDLCAGWQQHKAAV